MKPKISNPNLSQLELQGFAMKQSTDLVFQYAKNGF